MVHLNAPIDQIGFYNLRIRKLERWARLETERAPWFSHWQDLTRHINPRSGRYFPSQRNESGRHLYNLILDNTPTKAVRTLAAGMMTGASSPASPWFKLRTADPDLNDFHPVKLWLEDVVTRMMAVFSNSNTYRQFHTMYEELGTFGTSVSIILGSFEKVIHHFPSPVGEYALALDYNGRVDTMYRRFERSVGEVVREFGILNVSDSTKRLYETNHLEAAVEILHTIEPRRIRERQRADSLNMPFESCYLETGGESGQAESSNIATALLRVGGFNRFPVVAPRWIVNAGDVYGNSPGMTALGDIRQLNQEQLRKGQAIDYQTKPPLQVPSQLKDRDRETFPGGVSFYDQASPHGGIRTAFEVNLDLNALLEDIRDVRNRIDAAFFGDLFLAILNQPPQDRTTKAEILARQEEKLFQLGPVLGRVENEMLEPTIDMTFARMDDAGMIPPPPPDLLGRPLGVEFVSILAQAQRAAGLGAIDRWVEGQIIVGQSKPEALDKINTDALANVKADRLGVDPRIVVSDEDAEALRKARNEAIAAQEQANALAQQAEMAQTLSQTPIDESNALGALTGAPGGAP